jgi:GntR family transcriptional repressor for pyruvate dehydrogenase complex
VTEEASPGGYRPGYEVTAERILQFIAESGLRPGDRMPTELELARELSVSRSVTREAIKILSAIGRVRAHKGRGLYVADEPGLLGSAREAQFLPANLDHVFMLFEFRRTLEAELSRLAAARATPAELRAIEDAVERCQRAAEQDDDDGFHLGDDGFHLGVAAASHNPFLTAALETARRLQNQSSILGRSGNAGERVHKAVAEHVAIYQAIRDGRPDDAAAAAVLHVNNSLDDYNQEIRRRLFA